MYSFENLKLIVFYSIAEFMRYDSILLEGNSSEWSLSHRISIYLEKNINNGLAYEDMWNIDCEYNRANNSLGGYKIKSASQKIGKTERVRPDIIIHKRRKSELENNLIFIEIKKRNDDHQIDSDDLKKLNDVTVPPKKSRSYQYQFGLALSFIPKIKLIWIQNGQEIPLDYKEESEKLKNIMLKA